MKYIKIILINLFLILKLGNTTMATVHTTSSTSSTSSSLSALEPNRLLVENFHDNLKEINQYFIYSSLHYTSVCYLYCIFTNTP